MQVASLVLPLCHTGRQTPGQDYLLAHLPKCSQLPETHLLLDSHGRPKLSSLCVGGRQRTLAWGSLRLSCRASEFWGQQGPGELSKSPPFLTFTSFPIKLLYFIPIPIPNL